MPGESDDLIDTFYEKKSSATELKMNPPIRQSPKAKYQIFDEQEFTRGREILGNLIVNGMVTSGGTDLDWLIEHNGGFVILEFKGFHNDKINIPFGQMIAYERLHEKLNQASKCYMYFIGTDDIDFSNPDSKIWLFEMKQWKNGTIPKNNIDDFEENQARQKKFIIYRDYLEEISVEQLRKIIDSHWKSFE